jgi:endonuclease/exonuclease/phosphatase family metal-dependent hydrolase
MTRLRLMTYNMLHAPGDRLAPLVDVVKAVSPDVLACQEVNTFEGVMALSRELGMLPTWGVANSPEDYRDGQPVFEHLVVFTHLPPRAVRVHRGDRRAMFRPLLEVRLQPPGGPEITTFTVHLRAVIDPREPYLKFRELGSLLTAIGDAEGPVIAMGDFNAMAPGEAGHDGVSPMRTSPPEDHVAAVRGGVIGAIVDAGFVDSYRARHPFKGRAESTLIGRDGRRLDHILVSSSLGPCIADSYILDNEMARVASDHLPVVTELDFGVLEDPAQEAQAEAAPLSGRDVAVSAGQDNR